MKKSSTQVVLDAVRELHSQQQIVTRQTLVELTGLKPGVVDDRLSVLVDDLLVLRVERGVFVPAPQFDPPRPITITQIPGGWAKVEISDDHVITLTPAEKRMLGELLAGAAQQFAAIDIGHSNQIPGRRAGDQDTEAGKRSGSIARRQDRWWATHLSHE
ncbi:hypothetical protein VQ060_00005 [Pseudomonas sp. KBN06P05117]|uniref:hypothetical protein n=1 Tax=Pseudomonas sp. KBN06P05117 TaxID=3113717 RepID=UPI00309D1ABE